MKKIAILTAAGIGSRMKLDTPKQFLYIDGKPVIIHTMEAFQNHPDIDGIIVVCLDGWHDILESYAKEYNITKLTSIVSGGKSGQESIKNGLDEANRLFTPDTMVLIHDGNRPMVSQEIISNSIAVCQVYGNAVAVIPCTEVVFECDDYENASRLLDRDKLKRTQTPHTFILKDILEVHNEAIEKGITNEAASCSLYVKLGRQIHFSYGSERNFKLTTRDDLDIFNSMIENSKKPKTYLLSNKDNKKDE